MGCQSRFYSPVKAVGFCFEVMRKGASLAYTWTAAEKGRAILEAAAGESRQLGDTEGAIRLLSDAPLASADRPRCGEINA
ncbi:hypothetical protein G3480_08465 [Thiorhodococcus mannitoliphagus]|uniref:Uncharacterized protein n=1 Tax=Thiorhodococcus mannitoliphagus TaxID=329406 RepID=A0A6P1DQM9_9GAMM|nr:hypothetical protein [Thiorhodococcus mannitoliphagus]NEX20338.1 hypothetical protein [Thiorhodococcus mannitoliphagus]